MIVQKYRIEINGKPMRLYVNSKTKLRCAEPDEQMYNTFGNQQDATKKAALYELALLALGDYTISPFQRDIGTPTNLIEIGL